MSRRLAYKAEHVSKVFFSRSNPVLALDDVSMELEISSFTVIVGPSGCGKSTFLRIIGGLEEATEGVVKAKTSTRPAFVFQEHGVFPWLTVLNNVAFGLQMEGVGKTEREDIARKWIDSVGIGPFEDFYPHQLSGGMRQRIAIARAFAMPADTLLMDEPLGALDAQTRLLMQEELVRLWEVDRKTVLLVTHSIEEALILGDRIIVMSARPGRVKEEIQVPFRRPRTTEIERLPEFADMRHHIWEALRDEVIAGEVGR